MTSTDDGDELRRWAAALFARANRAEQEEETPPDPARGNHSPREGNNPQVDDPQAEAREYVRQLFNAAD